MTVDPGAATGQQPYEPSRYRKCPVCAAELGDPCLELSGLTERGGPVIVEADRPHNGRKLRAVSSRA